MAAIDMSLGSHGGSEPSSRLYYQAELDTTTAAAGTTIANHSNDSDYQFILQKNISPNRPAVVETATLRSAGHVN